MISILSAIAVIVVLVLIVNKNYKDTTFMFFLGIILFGILTIITGKSAVATTSGSLMLDLFEIVTNTSKKLFARDILAIMTVLGYVEYMRYIKAYQTYALLFSKPFRKGAPNYFLGVIAIFIGILLKLFITGEGDLTAMLLATIYPILVYSGLSKQSSASAILLSACFAWGPFNPNAAKIVTSSTWVSMQALPTLFMFVGVAAVYYISARFFDKKEAVVYEEIPDEQEIGVPKFYALFPLIPLILTVIFSDILGFIKIQVIPACFIAFIVTFIINVFVQKGSNFLSKYNDTGQFYKGMGDFVGQNGYIMVFGNIVGQAIVAMGVPAAFASLSSALGVGISAFLAVFFAGDLSSNIAAFGLLANNTLLLAGTMGIAVSFFSSSTLMIRATTDVSLPTLIKRNVLPVLAGLAMTLLATALF